jgi:hypothetical protein
MLEHTPATIIERQTDVASVNRFAGKADGRLKADDFAELFKSIQLVLKRSALIRPHVVVEEKPDTIGVSAPR